MTIKVYQWVSKGERGRGKPCHKCLKYIKTALVAKSLKLESAEVKCNDKGE